MKEYIDAFEISFDIEVEEMSFIQIFSKITSIPVNSFWNWDWNNNPSGAIFANIRYIYDPADEYTTNISIIFNDHYYVQHTFEADIAIALASHFNCRAVVNDTTSSDDTFIEVHPNGLMFRCVQGTNADGQVSFQRISDISLSYDEFAKAVKIDKI